MLRERERDRERERKNTKKKRESRNYFLSISPFSAAF